MTQIVDCRRTGQGAETTVQEITDSVEVHPFNRSRTGHHWQEEVIAGDGDEFIIIDISNSGKHSCQKFIVVNDVAIGQPIDTGHPCPFH